MTLLWLVLGCVTLPLDPDIGPIDDVEEQGADDPSGSVTVAGEVIWTLDFDDAAEAEGYTDCSYRRVYAGTQVLDLDYLCPDCDVIVRGDAVMSDGFDDCYQQFAAAGVSAQRVEMWGFNTATFFRSGQDQFPLGVLTDLDGAPSDTPIPLSWSSESPIGENGGTMFLRAAGEMTWIVDDSLALEEPFQPRTTPYSCGWPQNDPGDLVLDYAVGVGKTFPNVELVDQCGEKLALWDLYGSWLVLDTSQSDCGPCRQMAEGAEDFVADMAEEGYDVVVVSLLGNGLGEPFGTPDADTFQSWVDTYALTDPVLYDRGFAYALFPDFVEAYTGEGFGYPTWLIVDPEMNLVHGNVGFGTWDAVGDVIRARAE
ncbi:MAG: redoxin domain-containing protein [Myxococcota bacterium]